MAITSADINNQSFSIDRKGYDVDEVDVFLEFVADEIDTLNATIERLQARIAELSDAGAGEQVAFEAAPVVEGAVEAAPVEEPIQQPQPQQQVPPQNQFQQQQYQQAPVQQPEDKGGFGWGLLGCCIPLVG